MLYRWTKNYLLVLMQFYYVFVCDEILFVLRSSCQKFYIYGHPLLLFFIQSLYSKVLITDTFMFDEIDYWAYVRNSLFICSASSKEIGKIFLRDAFELDSFQKLV